MADSSKKIKKMQGAPDVPDPPNPVSPCTDKMDPERLSADIPKYKPYISATSWSNWEEFLAKLEDISIIQPQSWALPQLLSASIKALSIRQQSKQPVPGVSQDTMNILEKEVTAPPPVSAI